MDLDTGKERRVKTVFAGFCILLLTYLIITALWSFIGAFFFAILCYLGLKPVYSFLRSHGLGKTSAGLSSIAIGILVVGIPAMLIFGVLVSEVTTFIGQSAGPGQTMLQTDIAALQNLFPGIDFQGILNKELQSMVTSFLNYFQDLIFKTIQDAGAIAIQLLVVLFLLYYLLVWEDKVGKAARDLLPFSQKNKKVLVAEFDRITYSVLVSSGLMGVIQAAPLVIAFAFYGVPGALFLGFIAFILTFIPFVGIPFVWIPVMAAEFVQGDTSAAFGILIVGIILAILENARPLLQKNFGQLHPLISLLGVVIGVSMFGIMGVLIGPLMLSYALLGIRMFLEEYA